jgi:hypothetical protein
MNQNLKDFYPPVPMNCIKRKNRMVKNAARGTSPFVLNEIGKGGLIAHAI